MSGVKLIGGLELNSFGSNAYQKTEPFPYRVHGAGNEIFVGELVYQRPEYGFAWGGYLGAKMGSGLFSASGSVSAGPFHSSDTRMSFFNSSEPSHETQSVDRITSKSGLYGALTLSAGFADPHIQLYGALRGHVSLHETGGGRSFDPSLEAGLVFALGGVEIYNGFYFHPGRNATESDLPQQLGVSMESDKDAGYRLSIRIPLAE